MPSGHNIGVTRISVDQQTFLRLCSLAEPKPKYAFSLAGGAQLMVHLPDAEVVCDVEVDRDEVDRTGVDREGGDGVENVRPGAFRSKLEDLGVAVLPADLVDGSGDALRDFWVAVVAYRSEEEIPGIWVDAYASQPSAGEVLTDIYNEFFEEGDLGTLTFDDFERLAKPHVLVLSLDDLRRYMKEEENSEEPESTAQNGQEYTLDSPSLVREGRTVDLAESSVDDSGPDTGLDTRQDAGPDLTGGAVSVEVVSTDDIENDEGSSVAEVLVDEELPDSRRSETESNQ